MKSWNKMFNYIINIKHRYEQQYGYQYELFQDICLKLGEHKLLNDIKITENDDPSGHFILLKYSLLNGMDDIFQEGHMYREARSLVINLTKEEIVLCPFQKFFNINEIPETNINYVEKLISQADLVEFSDKLDGNMQQYRWYDNHIVYSGSSALSIEKSYQLKRGLDIFNSNIGYLNLIKAHPEYTYIFECILNDGLHIVQYKNESLKLIGARNVNDGSTITYAEVEYLGNLFHIPTTKIDNIDFENALNNLDKYQANEKEGWVIYIRANDNEYRYKLKCNDYVKIHHILDYMNSTNVVIKAIADNYYDDLISKVPAIYRERVSKYCNTIREFLLKKNLMIDAYYNKVKDIQDMKDFAKYVNQFPKSIRGYLYMKKKEKDFNLLKQNIISTTPKYIKYYEIEDFLNEYKEYMNELNNY